MGVYWRSRAEVISTEPKVIEELIKQISENNEEVTSVDDLRIEGNSVLFHSTGYGCYGTDFEDPGHTIMLFELLFENYDRALVCFEVVEPCQNQGYRFSASWAKPDSQVDWDNEETFYIYRRVVFEDEDELEEGLFDIADAWFKELKLLDRSNFYSIKKLVNLAKQTGFTDWEVSEQECCYGETVIAIKTIWKIGEYLKAESDEYDQNLVYSAICEAERDCFYWLLEIEIYNAEFQFPKNFPEIKSIYEHEYEKEQAQIQNEETLNIDNSLTLRLRTKNSLLELLQAGESGAWKVAKEKEQQIAKVQIFNWDGSLMLEASHDISNSRRREDNRLIVGLSREDAKIVLCNPPLEWIGQNPVSYIDQTSEKPKNNSVETEIKTIQEPTPNAPDGYDHLSSKVAELCESIYGEPVQLVYWQISSDQKQTSTLVREMRRGWYLQMLLTENNGQWISEERVLPSFLNLLEPDETIWAKLTQKATREDWYALDKIFLNTLVFPNSKVILAGEELVGENVADQAMDEFGFYVPDENMLPVLLFENTYLRVKLISYFRHPDGFAQENMVTDDNTNDCEVFESLVEAQQRLYQKLTYYTNEA